MSSDHGSRLRDLPQEWEEEAERFEQVGTELRGNRAGGAVVHEKQRVAAAYRRCASMLKVALLRASASAPPDWLSGPLVTNAMTESATRFKKLFAPVTYDDAESDTLAVRMLKKIHRVVVRSQHYHDALLTVDEMRSIHSAAVAGIEGPDPNFEQTASASALSPEPEIREAQPTLDVAVIDNRLTEVAAMHKNSGGSATYLGCYWDGYGEGLQYAKRLALADAVPALSPEPSALREAANPPAKKENQNGNEIDGYVSTEGSGGRADLRAQSAGQTRAENRASVGDACGGSRMQPSQGSESTQFSGSDGAVADAEVSRLAAALASPQGPSSPSSDGR